MERMRAESQVKKGMLCPILLMRLRNYRVLFSPRYRQIIATKNKCFLYGKYNTVPTQKPAKEMFLTIVSIFQKYRYGTKNRKKSPLFGVSTDVPTKQTRSYKPLPHKLVI
jgi:hypothetical protein